MYQLYRLVQVMNPGTNTGVLLHMDGDYLAQPAADDIGPEIRVW